MSWLRSVVGVLVGFGFLAGVLILVTPPAARAFGAENFRALNQMFMLVNLTYTSVAAILAGFITGWIAGRKEIRHASMLGLLMIIAAFVGMKQQGQDTPGWYEIVLGGCGPMAALVGAALCMLVRPRGAVDQAATAN